MPAEIGIEVAFSCRPWTLEDKLGCSFTNKPNPGDEEGHVPDILLDETGFPVASEGEVEMHNSTYQQTRFPFSYCWWGAFNWKRKCQDNLDICATQHNWSQREKYDLCGRKIKKDLLDGNAVVVFAYGLSGSGKTYTVFGFDDAKNPASWFNQPNNKDGDSDKWGIFPNLAYEVLEEDSQDGWKMASKYFQNMVDMVRDLMHPSAKEQHYKQGFRKSKEDGFMDIEWCTLLPMPSWDKMRSTFKTANARKGIAPTQFNPQSTRGHCVFTFEVQHPDPENPDMQKRGRLYLCDLAGTEPAGDVYCAEYKEIIYPDGEKEMQLIGKNSDESKTKELQQQGAKINQSLSEIKLFFEKLAEGIKKKTLKPGGKIPGCNSFFLSKYLKDTLLSAKTYLFCACRPEATYLKYTKATLDFAANASVVKLSPKKAGSKMSPLEKKLSEELEAMKEMVEQMQKDMASKTPGDGPGSPDPQVEQLKAILAQKQQELENAVYADIGGTGGGVGEMMEEERERYAQRGMFLAYFEKAGGGSGGEGTALPYLINVDDDSFRTERIMWLFDVQTYTVGPEGDIRPSSIAVVPNHCEIIRPDAESAVQVKVGEGKVYHNGAAVPPGETVSLAPHDRVGVGNDVYRFHWPGKDPETEPMSAEEIIREFATASQTVSEADKKMFEEQSAAQAKDHQDEMTKMEEAFQAKLVAMQEEMAKAAAEGGAATGGVTQQDIDKEKQAHEQMEAAKNAAFEENQKFSGVQRQLQDLMRKVPSVSKMCQMLDRPMLGFEVKLSPGATPEEGPKPKIIVRNSDSGEAVLQDPWEFDDRFNIVQDELGKVKQAIQFGTDYMVPEAHDPLRLLFDNQFKLGTATYALMECSVLMETEEPIVQVRSTVAPFNPVGSIEIMMTPIKSPEDTTPLGDDDLVDDSSELIGKPWTYMLEIKGAQGLTITSDETYVQYMFNGDLFCTEVVTEPTKTPKWEYKHIHHVSEVTQEFLTFLDEGSITYDIFVNPVVNEPSTKVGSSNSNIRKFLGGTPLNNATADGGATISPMGGTSVNSVASNATGTAESAQAQALEQQKAAAEQALAVEIAKVKELEAKVAELEKKAAEMPEATPTNEPSVREKQLEAEVAQLKDQVANAPQSSACTVL